MASYNELLALIDAYINRNGVQAITGQILNGVLKAMVDQLGRGYTLMGYAEPTGDPGTPDGPESWFASVPGTYTNYGEIQVAAGELALLSFAPSEGWTKNTIYEGFREVTATADDNIGFPQVGVTYANGVLSFDFKNIKGEPGENGQDGDPAGFGAVTASVDDQVGTPSVSVSSSGPDTAKVFSFAFHNLKGETGVTSVLATVDNTSGNPQCSVSLQGGQLTLAFTGLKGAQGNTGSSVDYPFTIVNNLTTDDPTQALSAAQGVVLAGQVSQLEHIVSNLSGRFYGVFDDDSDLPEGTGIGYAFVGTDEPLALFTFDGEDWTDTEVAISGIVGPPGEPGIQGIQGIQGPPGVTSVIASVDANTGVPSVDVALNNGVLTLTFHNLKGLQGNTGSSVSYPFTLVNNVVTDDATQALSAAMGKFLGDAVFGALQTATIFVQHSKRYLDADTGAEVESTADSNLVTTFFINDTSLRYFATGRVGANASTCLVAYYTDDGTFISSQFRSSGTAEEFHREELTIPSNCNFVKIFGNTSVEPTLEFYDGTLPERVSKLEKEIGVSARVPMSQQYGDGINTGYYLNADTGELVSGTTTTFTREYNISNTSVPYFADGRIGTNTSTCLAAYYDENGTFISSQFRSEGTAVIFEKQLLSVPSSCRMIRVAGSLQYNIPPTLYCGETIDKKVDDIADSVDELSVRVDDVTNGKNTGKTIGVFGGSLSVYPESQSAKDIWRTKLGVTITDYGVAGAGFSSLQGTTNIQAQVDGAASKDVYILWASTNDYRNNRECGTWKDYTAEDNYDSTKLVTQCGGINYCIKKLLTINPNAEIYFFTPLRFFSMESGYNPFSEETNTTGKTFAEYIAEMKKCCDYYGIPTLDQYDLQGVNIFNKSLYYKTDNLHMNEAGYEKIGWVQADFLANGE